MAGSYGHCATEDGKYRGTETLETLGDCYEAVEEMFFIIQHLAKGDNDKIAEASKEFFRCVRGKQPWPEFMNIDGANP